MAGGKCAVVPTSKPVATIAVPRKTAATAKLWQTTAVATSDLGGGRAAVNFVAAAIAAETAEAYGCGCGVWPQLRPRAVATSDRGSRGRGVGWWQTTPVATSDRGGGRAAVESVSTAERIEAYGVGATVGAWPQGRL